MYLFLSIKASDTAAFRETHGGLIGTYFWYGLYVIAASHSTRTGISESALQLPFAAEIWGHRHESKAASRYS